MEKQMVKYCRVIVFFNTIFYFSADSDYRMDGTYGKNSANRYNTLNVTKGIFFCICFINFSLFYFSICYNLLPCYFE